MKKKNNQTAKIMQQGGLMIEALAMLGLIAVVTPTMYKKSAERTLEVEDINTATTVRTYMNAAEAYIANNYGDLMVNEFSTRNEDGKLVPVASGSKVVTVTPEQMAAYLPYKFDTDRSLYDYKTPQVRIVNNGTNLTAFALFPAKQDAANGIGQERTSRIASLIGANGGYMPDANTARGVGGIWNLDQETMNKVFNGVEHNQYSLVAASSNVISDVNGGELDNDKYLQRTLEGDPNNPESYKDQLWRNTMHTDLYMGNHLQGETQSIHSSLRQRNSIRDVKSLIIGAEKASTVTSTDEAGKTQTSESTNNGLYINGTDGQDYADAYIGGALRATAEQFVVTANGTDSATTGTQMLFGKNGTEYNFEVDENGDILDYGHKGTLYNRFKEENDNIVDIAGNVIEISNPNGILNMHIMDNNTFHVYQNINGSGEATDMQMDIMENGYKGVYNSEGKDSIGNNIGPQYNNKPPFPVHVGSNMAVEGVLAAGQVDTQHLRTASLTSGSEKIDDEYKWLTVDKDGVRIRDPKGEWTNKNDDGKYTTLHVSGNGAENGRIAMRVGTQSATNTDEFGLETQGRSGQLVLNDNNGKGTLAGKAHQIDFNATDDADEVPGYIKTRNSMVQIMVGSESTTTGEGESAPTTYTGEIKFSGFKKNSDGSVYESKAANYRVRQVGGHMDLDSANLHIVDEEGNQVFSVRGNANENDGKFNNDYTKGSRTNNSYDVASHGKTLFTSNRQNIKDGDIKYMSVGTYNDEAGVNIVAEGKTATDAVQNVLIVDQSEDVDSTKLPDSAISTTQYTSEGTSTTAVSQTAVTGEPGTVYIRKGMIDIVSGANQGEEYKKAFLAHEGAGVIRAARFVANNIDSNKHAYKVPTKLTSNEYNLYNGGGTTRYDTYMVNPAYTSVMNDIKLTSRGGARLSDILPDFINKGIYVANNTNKYSKFPKSGSWNSFDYDVAGYDEEVSPYLGKVPAPQCPPGYGRVITVAPTGFKMAQAGGIELKGDRFVVTEYENGPGTAFQSKDGYDSVKDKFDPNENENGKREADNFMPNYQKLRSDLEGQATLKLSGSFSEDWYERSTGASGTMNININDDFTLSDMTNNFPIKMCDQTKAVTDGQDCELVDTYVLSSNSANAFKPLLFQQSTYLKTAVIPICSNGDTEYGQTCSGEKNGKINYTQGWAVLMGFIYPENLYKGVFDAVGAHELAQETSTNTTWYWNIFPVLRGTLEAYATVYCHYDRTNIWNGYDENEVDGYDYMNAADSFYPKDSGRRQKLNDPTLKYNELW